MTCTAKIRPLPNDTEIQCEKEDDGHTSHEGVLRDYAYEGSKTVITWLDSDRRTFRGTWKKCKEKCVLPANHKGNHAP